MHCVFSALHVIVCLEDATTKKAAEEEAAKLAAETMKKAEEARYGSDGDLVCAVLSQHCVLLQWPLKRRL